MTREFGECMEGTEEAFEKALRERAKPGKPFVYMQIGVHCWKVFAQVVDILGGTGAEWQAYGVDPSEESKSFWGVLFTPVKHRTFHIPEASPALMKGLVKEANFVFIDKCHAKKCVMTDFLAAERLVVPGGLVVFHDFGEGSSGWQPHCEAPLDIRGAAKELGLLDGKRPGWKRLPDWIGDASKNGASCGVFERVQVTARKGV